MAWAHRWVISVVVRTCERSLSRDMRHSHCSFQMRYNDSEISIVYGLFVPEAVLPEGEVKVMMLQPMIEP